ETRPPAAGPIRRYLRYWNSGGPPLGSGSISWRSSGPSAWQTRAAIKKSVNGLNMVRLVGWQYERQGPSRKNTRNGRPAKGRIPFGPRLSDGRRRGRLSRQGNPAASDGERLPG